MIYDQKLLDPRWLLKRETILIRDRHSCNNCFTRFNLQVHHLGYIAGADPWQVPDEFLVTLCENCHAEEEKYKREIKGLIRELSLSGNTYKDIFNHIEKLK